MTHIDIYGMPTSTLLQPRRRRRQPREKSSIPIMTTGLETKLNKALKCNADNIIRYLTTKFGEPKKSVFNGYVSMVFGKDPSYYQCYRTVSLPSFATSMTIDELTVPIQTRNIYFQISLSIKELDNTLDS